MYKHNNKFISTCAAGLETLVADELVSFGGQVVSTSSGAVSFTGSLETAYRACLWSRFASRILMPLVEFTFVDFESLYNGALKVDWNDHFSADGKFAVECTARVSPVDREELSEPSLTGGEHHNTRFAELRIKDAVVDQFRLRFGIRPSVDLKKPDVRIHAFLDQINATISLDMSGNSLHRRGYRVAGGEAPLKETLAAGILGFTGWSSHASDKDVLLDPMCGSGTLLIEASLMWGNIAPGLERDYFGFMSWKGHDIKLWESLVLEAGNIKRESINRPWPRIIGYDSSRSAINLALDNVKNSGLDGIIHLERKELANLNNPLSKDSQSRGSKGFLVVNPPYGERIGSLDEVRCLYRCLGRKMKDEFQGWRTGVFTNHVELADAMGMPSETKHRLYNGPLVCSLYVSDVPPAAKKQVILQQQAPRKYPHNADAFANRLKKNFNHLSKWAARESVSCFRIYDADIPEYNIAVDLYEQFVHVQEYAPPDTIDPDKARERFKNSLLAIREVLGIHGRQIFIKVRRRQKDGVHYQKKEGKGKIIEVNEKNCRFLLNMTDYIDTGLFLDQRITRSIIQEKAKGKRFLNLFAYTGTATVHAAMGGAKTTTSVDSSQAYISWAKSNLALNGFSSENHKFIKSECMKWLLDTREQFDLIFVDPPTFSNSRSRKNTFDVQSDHVTLIRHAMRRLDSGGLLIFSSNFRKFKLDANALSEFILKDISLATIPRDFERNKLIHRCWLIQRKN